MGNQISNGLWTVWRLMGRPSPRTPAAGSEPNVSEQNEDIRIREQNVDPEHVRIIKENRVLLVERIDLDNTLILDQLTQDGVLWTTELEAIKQENSTKHQRASALLDHLDRRPPEDWEKFLKCLSMHHHDHVVQQIRKDRIGSTRGPDSLRRLLADTFLRFYNKIDMWSWYDRHVAVPMDKIYVELVWVRVKDDIRHMMHHRLASYTEVFSEVTLGERGQLIFLSGEPGVGKSTISRRICVDWSNTMLDKKAEITTGQTEVLSKFKYVIPIILRDVKTEQTLVDVLKEQLLLESEHAKQLYELIRDNQPSTLFVLDGFDEYREKTSKEITNLAHRGLFPYAQILVTSRHSPESHFPDQRNLPETEVALRGFSREGVTEYIQKSFKHRTKNDGDSLLQKIEESDDIRRLSRYPAVLLLMCCLWEETKQLAATVPGFYRDFIKYSCCRFEKKNMEKEMRTQLKNIFDVYHKCLLEIGEIATGGLMGDRLELTFSYEHVRNTISEKAWKLGFIIEEMCKRGQKRVSFVHKTVQEWFVAFYIVNATKSKQHELLLHFCSSPLAFRESSMIVDFSAALGGTDVVRQMSKIIKGKEDMALMHTSLHLSYLSEHEDADLVLPEVMHLDITDKFPAQVYVKYLSMNGEKVRKMSLKSCKERHLRLLQHLKAPSLKFIWLSVKSRGLPCCVEESYMEKKLDATLTSFPLHTLKFSRGIFSKSVLDDGDGDDDSYNTPDLMAVIRAIEHIKTLEEVEFEWTPMTSVALHELTERLSATHVVTLTLKLCYLTSQHFWLVLDKLPNCHQLTNLGVQNNDLDDTMEELINNTEKLIYLRRLDLSANYDISDRVREQIKEMLAIKCPDLNLMI